MKSKVGKQIGSTVCSESQCTHVQLSPDVTHVREDTRTSTFFVQSKMARAWEQGYYMVPIHLLVSFVIPVSLRRKIVCIGRHLILYGGMGKGEGREGGNRVEDGRV